LLAGAVVRPSSSEETAFRIDKDFFEEVRLLEKYKTELEAIRAALDEYVRRRKQLRILDLFGTIDFDPECDYKAWRSGKRTE
jgi:hypothetical protein